MESLPVWAPGEELLNTITHGVMIPIVLFLTGKLIKQQMKAHDKIAITGVAIYGFAVFAMFFNSTVYHGSTYEPLKRVLRYIDHCTIFILIAGTYTPTILYAMRTWSGISLLAFVWTFALIGIISKIFFFDMIPGTYIYLIMGWSIMVCIKEFMRSFDRQQIIWIVAGGLSYTFGCIFYEIDEYFDYVHMIFHVFIAVGALCHFRAVYLLGERFIQKPKANA